MFPTSPLLLLLVTVSSVHCQVQLNQQSSVATQPGQVLTLSCGVSGYSLTDSSYCTNWVKQPAGKALEWIGRVCGSGNVYHSEKLKNKFSVSRDTSSSTVNLKGQSLQTEDSAVYYCAREEDYGYGFDYWGKGTMVTVSSGAPEVPTSIFALSQCGSDSEFVTLGCVMSGFSPADSKKYLWKDASGTDLTDFIQYPDILKDGKYSKISQIRVKAADWEAKKDFTCEVVGTDKKAVITKPEEILQIPTLYLMKPTSEEINQNNTATFACLATDFSPPVHTFKWMKEVGSEETVITGSYSFTSPANGNNSATSYLQIPGNVWKTSGTKITCVFEHKSGNKTRSVEYRFSYDPCDDEKAVEVEIMPPSTEDLLVRKEGWVQCKITKQIEGVNKDYLEWRKDGKAAVLDKKTDLKEDGSSITMKLKVTFEEWENGTEFSCFVPHESIPSGIIKSYKRENDICIVWTDYQSYGMDGDGMANTAFTFIFLFLIMLFYSVGATVIKVK